MNTTSSVTKSVRSAIAKNKPISARSVSRSPAGRRLAGTILRRFVDQGLVKPVGRIHNGGVGQPPVLYQPTLPGITAANAVEAKVRSPKAKAAVKTAKRRSRRSSRKN